MGNQEVKMPKDEREIAARVVNACAKITAELRRLHEDSMKLMEKYGWNIDEWDISQAGMLIGNIGLGIAQSIGCEDGWCKDGEVAQ